MSNKCPYCDSFFLTQELLTNHQMTDYYCKHYCQPVDSLTFKTSGVSKQVDKKDLKIQELEAKLLKQNEKEDQFQRQIEKKEQKIGDLQDQFQRQIEKKDQKIEDLQDQYQKQVEKEDQKIQALKVKFQLQIKEKNQELEALQDQYQKLIEKKDRKIQELEDKLKKSELKLENEKPALVNEKISEKPASSSSPTKKMHEKDPNSSSFAVKRVPKGKEQDLKDLLSQQWNISELRIREDTTSADHSYVSVRIASRDGAPSARLYLNELKKQDGYEWLSKIVCLPRAASTLQIQNLPQHTDQNGLMEVLSQFGTILSFKLETSEKNRKFMFGAVEFEEKEAAEKGKECLAELKAQNPELNEVKIFVVCTSKG